ncbi:hypothetical protein [Thermoplasma sp. Kam2015]|uniref:hypothetical protein n=1 Tax=Thermoplasma sp. Kam2015 TaxID=2094122 RepID=UPI0012940877|nr:hypothetical protein [Thermoplasma sp. Kam2015]
MVGMIKTTKVYLDRKTGGLRIYIPRDMAMLLKWNDHENIVLMQKGSQMTVIKDSITERQQKMMR